MLTPTLKTVQVVFDSLDAWKPEYKIALAEFLISCSQWEYTYELLWKDMNRDPQRSFLDEMKDADGEVKNVEKNLKTPLLAEGSQECKEIAALIEGLERSFRDKRHVMVHGFHHIYQGQDLISRISHHGDDVIGQVVSPTELKSMAKDINERVIKLNVLRRKKYHSGHGAFAASAAATG